ncbi:TatD family hydrolase [Bacillota bacterium LX-D]|nr:TatD family hydrolase [Bacillota bacterium LX-D]
MLIDTHAHLNDPTLLEDLPEVLQRAAAAGVEKIVNIGYDFPSSQKAAELAAQYSNLYAAVGIHPHDAFQYDEHCEELKTLAQGEKVVAIGEIGLDYYRDLSPRDKQQEIFRAQINLAKELKLPIIIHDRDAHGDVLQIMQEEKANEVGGILHCFSGSWEMAKECLKLGFYISFAGPVTFKNARRVQEVAQQVPLDWLLVETDCPYLAPEPYRGKRNEPAYVVETAKKIAELREMPFEELAAATKANAQKLFKIN